MWARSNRPTTNAYDGPPHVAKYTWHLIGDPTKSTAQCDMRHAVSAHHSEQMPSPDDWNRICSKCLVHAAAPHGQR